LTFIFPKPRDCLQCRYGVPLYTRRISRYGRLSFKRYVKMVKCTRRNAIVDSGLADVCEYFEEK